ncbi:DUF397 domain-containing protein [Streptomyces sp. NPDC003077]|uniref:DUF397 domain-containing protein n=1 Tax=Streptomyces sp. NPDC003077 TaxID=3154443 RepID=UPI0033A9AFB7
MTEHTIPDAALLGGWRTSSYSASDAGTCVEVLDTYVTGAIPVRDSKTPHGPALLFAPRAWASFVTAVRSGELHA